MVTPKVTLVDLSRDGEPEHHFVLSYRTRSDGRRSTWVCRLRLPKSERSSHWPYSTFSLRTTDLTVARERAFAWRREQDAALATQHQMPTFRAVSESWLQHIETERNLALELGEKALGIDQFRRYRTSVRRYLQPFFEDVPINAISKKKTDGYGHWRRTFYTRGPGRDESEIVYERDGKTVAMPSRKTTQPARSTVAKDAEVFNKIIAYAISVHGDLEWLGKPTLEGVTVGSRSPTRRPRFEHDHVRAVLKVAEQRAYAANLAKRPRHRYARQVLLSLIRFLWCTGARTSEALVLRIRDIKTVNASRETRVPAVGRLQTQFKGDWTAPDLNHPDVDWANAIYDYEIHFPAIKHVSHERRATPRLEFEDWYAWHGKILGSRFGGTFLSKLDPDLLLFPDWEGERLTTVDDNHDSLLESCKSKKWPDGLLRINGKKMSLSSWRHTYASEMIEAFAKSRRPNMIRFLASNMGTSEAMIEQHYGQILPAFAKDELRI
jgi:integrase